VKKIMAPFVKTREYVEKLGAGKAYMNHMNFEKAFPGKAQELRRAALSKGIKKMEDFRGEIRSVFKNTPIQMRKMISHAIEDGTDLSMYTDKAGRSLEEIKQEAIRMFKEMADEEVALGIRSSR